MLHPDMNPTCEASRMLADITCCCTQAFAAFSIALEEAGGVASFAGRATIKESFWAENWLLKTWTS